MDDKNSIIGVRSDEVDKVEREYQSMKDQKKRKMAAPMDSLMKSMLAPQQTSEEPQQKKAKMTTAADIKLRTETARQDKAKVEAPKFQKAYKVYCRYMKHPLLRPKIEAALGSRFFRDCPRTLPELEGKLDGIRTMFNEQSIHDGITGAIVVGSGIVEKTVPRDLVNLEGYQGSVVASMEDISETLAEAECEYGWFFECPLYQRLASHFVKVAAKTHTRNMAIEGSNLQAVAMAGCDLMGLKPKN